MDTTLLLILIAGALLVLILGAYALQLWRKVWKHRELLQEHERQTRGKLGEDLKILCGSLLDEQVPWVEGCIRLKVILEHYDYELSRDGRYDVFREVFVATKDIPSHDAWLALNRQERARHEETFEQLENRHREHSLSAARGLLEHLGGPVKTARSSPVGSWSPSMEPEKPTLH